MDKVRVFFQVELWNKCLLDLKQEICEHMRIVRTKGGTKKSGLEGVMTSVSLLK